MTTRERFLAFAGFRPVDRVPRHADFVESLHEKLTESLGRSPREHFVMDIGSGAGLTPPDGYQEPDWSGYFPEFRVGEDGFRIDGIGCGHVNRGFYHFTEYVSPLRNARCVEELESFPWVCNEGWSDVLLRKACVEAHASGVYSNCWIGHMYENAWQVRGYEAFLMDLLTRRDWAELLLDRFCANNARTADAAGRAGYDLIGLGDDVANQNALMFHPDLWREVMKPRWARVIKAARRHKPEIQVWYHSDGNVWDILDDLVEIGITILNPVQPECMDPLVVRRRFGSRLAFDGCVGTQTTFPFGTPTLMHDTVRTLVESLDGIRGGLMLAPTHVLEPEVPVPNVVAFFAACDEARER